MSFFEGITFLGLMVALAALPSASVALVVARAATLGFANGAAVTLGIIAGDLVLILLAIFGLTMVAEMMGGLFMIVRFLGATYLIWLGYQLCFGKREAPKLEIESSDGRQLAASCIAGFFLTLGDVKAILFYASLFPMFLDVSALSVMDVINVMLVTVLSVGGVKLLYARSASKFVVFAGNFRHEKILKQTAGGLMIGAGSYILIKT